MLPFLLSLKETSKTPWSCLLSWSFLGWIFFFQVKTNRPVVLSTFFFHSQISRAGPKHHLLLFTPCLEQFPSPLSVWSALRSSLHLRCSEVKENLSPWPLATCCGEKEGLFARLWLPQSPSGTSGLCSPLPTCSCLVSILSTKLCCWQWCSPRQESPSAEQVVVAC